MSCAWLAPRPIELSGHNRCVQIRRSTLNGQKTSGQSQFIWHSSTFWSGAKVSSRICFCRLKGKTMLKALLGRLIIAILPLLPMMVLLENPILILLTFKQGLFTPCLQPRRINFSQRGLPTVNISPISTKVRTSLSIYGITCTPNPIHSIQNSDKRAPSIGPRMDVLLFTLILSAITIPVSFSLRLPHVLTSQRIASRSS